MHKTSGNTILLTGASSGIGHALAQRFAKDGNTVIAVARREDKLNDLAKQFPDKVHALQGDVETAAQRETLVKQALEKYPSINILLNNAGIQRTVDVKKGVDPDLKTIQSELDINLSAPIHLTLLVVKHLQQQSHAVIMNVTSGLSFVPLATIPVYCPTKAALHSFTWCLRHQLKDTSVKVVEIIPPAVNTDLNAPGKHTFGTPLDEFTDAVYDRIKKGEEEMGYGFSEQGRLGYTTNIQPLFEQLNSQHH